MGVFHAGGLFQIELSDAWVLSKECNLRRCGKPLVKEEDRSYIQFTYDNVIWVDDVLGYI